VIYVIVLFYKYLHRIFLLPLFPRLLIGRVVNNFVFERTTTSP